MSRKLAAFVFALFAAGVYWYGLRAPFVWDDDVAITTNQSIHEIGTSLNPPIETPVAGRPVVNLSFALNYAFGELDPLGYHVFNVAVLVCSALLLAGIVRVTLGRHLKGEDDSSLDAISRAAAMLWMVHPLLSETVYYATQRTESLMGLFYLLTLYAAIRAMGQKAGQKKRRAAVAASPGWTALAILSCAAGMATKESMVTAPIAVVLYDLIFEFDSPAEAWKARRNLYVGLAATWVELGLILWHWPRSTVGIASVGPFVYLFNQAQMIARYLWLTVWPHALVVDYGLPRQLHLTDVLLPGMVVVATLAATVVALVRWPKAGFLGAMFFLTLAPTSSVIPIASEVGAERRMYLPLAALAVLAVLALIRLERLAPKKIGLGLTVVLIGGLAARTHVRAGEFASPLTLWETNVARWPQGRSRFALANQLMDAGRHEEATAELRLAIADYPDARAGLGTELLLQGKIDEGISVLEAFVQANPSLPNRIPANVLLAQAYRAVAERELTARRAPAAEQAARKSLALDSTNADAHNLLGAALASQNNLAAAIPEFREAVRINPKHETALRNLAQATAFYGRSNTSNATGR